MPTPNLLTKPIEAMLGEAISAELFASHLYLHLANQMQFVGYFGAQKFFLAEAAAEREHYQRLVEFMNKRGSWARVGWKAATAGEHDLPGAEVRR
ncbi:ferritin-like domain-containing protein [Zoogloea sp.]|uniref:ferritin-like domain-containing protein n=1 Tax=Zoogloea sp. TaxID=49181 RepID=UPI002602591D|nr:ferritin-like domain-containing protein [Zoogloea sp.]MDD3354379.1 ferritin-like domain-containing protein [Zoogloea sp.]